MKTIVPLRFLFTVGQVLLHARTCIEVHSHRVRTGVLPLIARRNRFGVAVVKYVLSPPEVMAALPPRDAINTQIATTKFLGTTSTNIYASRYQSRLVFPLFSRYLERISDWNREWYSDLFDYIGQSLKIWIYRIWDGWRIFLFFLSILWRIDCKIQVIKIKIWLENLFVAKKFELGESSSDWN